MDNWEPPSLRWEKEPLRGQQIRILHPDHVGAVVALHGLAAPHGARCRVLEIGCGDAWNLLPMAEAWPAAEFVGVELDAERLARGEAARQKLGLENLTLRAADFATLDTSAGRFDYVVAHGVYAWVGDAVREVFFERLAGLLRDGGVAFVSTNVYPGLRTFEPARELALFHAHESRARDGEPLVKRLRGLARFFGENMARAEPEAALVANHYRRLAELPDYLFAFDELAETRPSYFEPLVRRAERAGLSFVADAGIISGYYARLPERLRQGIAELTADRIAREQYADFCALPTFRHCVFAKTKTEPVAASPERLRGLFLLGGFRQADASDATRPGPTAFEFEAMKFNVELPLVKVALLELGAIFPHAMSGAELEERARARLGTDAVEPRFWSVLLELVLAGALFVRVRPVGAATAPGERPRISESSRLQLRSFERATTALHTFVGVKSAFDREALCACDGRRSRDEIVGELVRLLNAGAIAQTELGPAVGVELTTAVSRRLEKTLANARNFALLVPEE